MKLPLTSVILCVILMLSSNVRAMEPDKQDIRKQWEQTVGCDIWAPYFGFKEIEKKFKKKLSVRIGPFRGLPEWDYKKKYLEYRFTWKF